MVAKHIVNLSLHFVSKYLIMISVFTYMDEFTYTDWLILKHNTLVYNKTKIIINSR